MCISKSPTALALIVTASTLASCGHFGRYSKEEKQAMVTVCKREHPEASRKDLKNCVKAKIDEADESFRTEDAQGLKTPF